MKSMHKPDLTDTSVSHNRHKCLSRRTQASDTTNTCVYQTPLAATRKCKCCGRQLPADCFYMRDRLNNPDSYCKECRKAANRQRRKTKACQPALHNSTPACTAITCAEQRETRLRLILHALQVVHESIVRQREKTHEKEFRRECNEPDSFPEYH